jgi:acyl carrier protein
MNEAIATVGSAYGRLADLVVAKVRVWNKSFTADDLDRSLFELNLDSLDTLEVVHLLERQCQVTSDAAEVAELETLRQYIDYFLATAAS